MFKVWNVRCIETFDFKCSGNSNKPLKRSEGSSRQKLISLKFGVAFNFLRRYTIEYSYF